MTFVLSISKESMDRAFMSWSETYILARLLYSRNGTESSLQIKKETLIINHNDFDELEEGLENLRVLGYIKYKNRFFTITKEGKNQIKEMSVKEPNISNLELLIRGDVCFPVQRHTHHKFLHTPHLLVVYFSQDFLSARRYTERLSLWNTRTLKLNHPLPF